MTGALEIRASHRLSYWDAAIVAAARALGCEELYSEDMSHGRRSRALRSSIRFDERDRSDGWSRLLGNSSHRTHRQ